ncbi:hypothetical protein NLJ89_g6569 [Agrocybe chaxingu]|uniref:Flavin-containing monooxygenase n=1 Tax=Agrocybe chaxingu TaxID=84603 RepID=A0A9W8JYZ9_9AGAR|nr:hypothetical protein NLJ89_g6569 [Agrocybe chaxingu]
MGSVETPSLHRAEAPLPVLSKLGNPNVPEGLDVVKTASTWLESFAKYAELGDADGVLSLLVNSSFTSGIFKPEVADIPEPTSSDVAVYWRDVLALTWDFRTFESTPKIKQFLADRLAEAKITGVQLQKDAPPQLQRPYPDLAWIQVVFTFETKVGLCSGIARLIPFPGPNKDTLDWKACAVFTGLDDLKGFPEKVGSLRNREPNHGKWEEARRKEMSFEGGDPTVLIIGGGQSGLEVAARLKALDISTLVVEKNKRIGDNWRTRYEALCLHDPVWYDHMPYIPFPPTWPVYTPAKKLANWLEYYAEAMELNVWTSSTVLSATQDAETRIWFVKVKQSDGTERVFKVKHVVIAIGFKGGRGYIPTYPGMDTFKGQILHSTQHDRALDHAGKKVVVVGSCTSAHDISVDYADHGVDVTMFQRSSTYVMSTKNGIPLLLGSLYSEHGPSTELADKINASFPNLFMAGMAHRVTKLIAEADKETLDGLHKRGFRTNDGYKDCGLILMVWAKAGGYYMDVGGSQYIIDGKIKLKNDSQIQSFTPDGLKFEDGSTLLADVVVFCTGLADPRHAIRSIFGDEVAERSKPVWGINEEGEINGSWRDLGYKGMWYMMGNLAMCRFYSKHLALQIKAMEEGIFDGNRYTAAE